MNFNKLEIIQIYYMVYMIKIATETIDIEHKVQNLKKSMNPSLLNTCYMTLVSFFKKMNFVNRCRCTTVNNDYNDPFF